MMSEQQIKDYLEKYRIKSAPQLADHIGELKRNTIPNVVLISELVYILEDDSSFFFRTKEPEKLQKTINNHILEIMSNAFFLDETIEAGNKSTNSTRHKSINGETHKELTTEKKLKITEGFKKEALKQQLDAILENIEIQSSYISPKKKEEIKTDWIDFVANGMKRGKIIKYENSAEKTEKEDAMVNKRDIKIGHSPFEKDNGIKESEGKLYYELSWEFIEQMAKRMSNNKSDKYPLYNWKKNINVEDLKQAINRHHIEVMKGNYKDGDEVLGHIVAYACNSMMLWEQLNKNQ